MDKQQKIAMAAMTALVIIILAIAIYGYLSGSWDAN